MVTKLPLALWSMNTNLSRRLLDQARGEVDGVAEDVFVLLDDWAVVKADAQRELDVRDRRESVVRDKHRHRRIGRRIGRSDQHHDLVMDHLHHASAAGARGLREHFLAVRQRRLRRGVSRLRVNAGGAHKIGEQDGSFADCLHGVSSIRAGRGRA